MVAFNFTVFTDKVAAREKRMTIRRAARAKPGDKLQLYTGMRTKACRKLVDDDATCEAVFSIKIAESGITLRPSHPWHAERTVILGNDPIIDKWARADGFTDWPSMRDWFAEKYGLPFTGYAHMWGWPSTKDTTP